MVYWSNSASDTPKDIHYYGNPYNSIVHTWAVSQNVNFYFRIIYKS